jgi:hypothetical protein
MCVCAFFRQLNLVWYLRLKSYFTQSKVLINFKIIQYYNFIAMFLSVTILTFNAIIIREIIKLQIAYDYENTNPTREDIGHFFMSRQIAFNFVQIRSACSLFLEKLVLTTYGYVLHEECHISLLNIYIYWWKLQPF